MASPVFMRDCLTRMVNIFLTGFNFESAAAPVLYASHKIAGRHYSAFTKGQGESSRIPTRSLSSFRQAFPDRVTGGQDAGLLCTYHGASRPNHRRDSTGL